MDNIKEMAEKVLAVVKEDKKFAGEFERNPSAAVRGKLGGHLSDEQIKKIIKLVKSKLESEGHSRKSSGDMLTALYEIGKLPD